VLAIGYDQGRLLLAMADPSNVFALDDVRSMTGFEPRPVVATREDLLAAIDRFCRADGGPRRPRVGDVVRRGR
jgi:type IV pilus assembly protein PilB